MVCVWAIPVYTYFHISHIGRNTGMWGPVTVRAMYIKTATSSLINTLRASTASLPLYRFRNCMTSLFLASRLYIPHSPIVGQKCVLKCASRPCATLYVMFSLCLYFLHSTRQKGQCVCAQNKFLAVKYEVAHRTHVFTFLYLDRLHPIANTAYTSGSERGPYSPPPPSLQGAAGEWTRIRSPQLLLSGPPNLHCLSKMSYIKFKTEWNIPFTALHSPVPHRTEGKARVYCFFTLRTWLNLFSFVWLICCKKYVTALLLWREVTVGCHWSHCNRTFKNWQVFIRNKIHPVYSTSY
jgi:hypothetical protein